MYLLRNGTNLTETIWGFYSDAGNQPRMKVKYGSKTPGKPLNLLAAKRLMAATFLKM